MTMNGDVAKDTPATLCIITYGQTVNFGLYGVDAAGVVFDVIDQDNLNCRDEVSVNISSCIYSGVCTCCE